MSTTIIQISISKQHEPPDLISAISSGGDSGELEVRTASCLKQGDDLEWRISEKNKKMKQGDDPGMEEEREVRKGEEGGVKSNRKEVPSEPGSAPAHP
jgi:hypothetical protein